LPNILKIIYGPFGKIDKENTNSNFIISGGLSMLGSRGSTNSLGPSRGN